MHSSASWITVVLAVLATWRLARLVAFEDGPGDVVVRVRRWAGEGWFGHLMDCPYCLSIWFAAPAALAVDRTLSGWLVAWLGISGGASLLQELVERVKGEPLRDRDDRPVDFVAPLNMPPIADAFAPVSPDGFAADAAAVEEEKSDVLLWEPSRRGPSRPDHLRSADRLDERLDERVADRRPEPPNVRPARPLGVPRIDGPR